MGGEWAMTALLLRLRGIIQKVAAATGLSSYAVLNTYEPETVADFENEYYRSGGSDTTFTGLLSFSRASTATYFDQNGDLQTAATSSPRVGHHVYNGTSWVNQGLLLEPSRTNLHVKSEDLSFYNQVERGSLSYSGSAPDGGTNNAILYTENSSTGRRLALYTGILSTTGIKTFSVFAKDNGRRYLQLICERFDGFGAIFDLSGGAVTDTASIGSGTYLASNIYPVGNGWYRCAVTGNANRGDFRPMIEIRNSSTYGGTQFDSYTGDNSSGVYFWGMQVESGYNPTSYIATTTASVARAADSLTIAGTDLTYDSTNMSFAMDGVITYADEGTAAQHTFFEWVADANNYISMDLDTDSTDTGEVNGNQSATGTLTTVAATSSYSAGAYVPYSIAMRNTSSAINIAKDGTAETEDTSPTQLPDLSATSLVFAEDNAVMTVKTFRQWGDDITDAGIEAAS